MKSLVIKVGGALLQQPGAAKSLFKVIKQLSQAYAIVLVHGGGNSVEQLLRKLGFSSEKYQGLRVTPDEQLPYVVGALAGTVNTQLVAYAKEMGCSSVGLSLGDADICDAQTAHPKLGCVGDVEPKNASLLQTLLQQGHLPIISSIAITQQGQMLNVNADQAATCIAQLLQAELVLLSDVPGVLDEHKQLLPELDNKAINKLIMANVIVGGMQVKVKAALETADAIAKPVTISSWQEPEQLLQLLSGGKAGTRILPNGNETE